MSKRSAPTLSSTDSSFKSPSPFYQASQQQLGGEHQLEKVGHLNNQEGGGQFIRPSLANSKSGTKSPVRRGVGNHHSDGSRGAFPVPPGNYTAHQSMNYHCNPLDAMHCTTQWDDDGDDDYSHSISGGAGGAADDETDSDATEDVGSSIYDNSPVVYRPSRGNSTNHQTTTMAP